jgi:hypothetical protein
MSKYVVVLFVGFVSALASGCAPAGAPEPETPYRATATIKDIMLAVIDPSADAIWDATAIVVDAEGVHESFPETDEEWDEVRNGAIRVLEGSNLLLIPGRRVAAPGDQSEFPGIELHPEEIQELIDQDTDTFVELALGLHDAAMETLTAIEARDADTLLAIGDNLDRACERCHLEYWYPDDEAARELFEQNEALRNQ